MKIEKYRNNLDYSYTIGISLTVELLKQRPKEVMAVYLSPVITDDEVKEINALCQENHITPITSHEILETISPKEDCLAVGVFKKYKSGIKHGDHLVLINPNNTVNLGAILRSAVALDFNNVAIIRPCVEVFDPRTLKASNGEAFKVNFSYFNSFEDYSAFNKTHNYYPFKKNAKKALSEVEIKHPASLIFGNDLNQLDESYDAFNTLTVKNTDKIDNLTFPTTVSIAMYEANKK